MRFIPLKKKLDYDLAPTFNQHVLITYHVIGPGERQKQDKDHCLMKLTKNRESKRQENQYGQHTVVGAIQKSV